MEDNTNAGLFRYRQRKVLSNRNRYSRLKSRLRACSRNAVSVVLPIQDFHKVVKSREIVGTLLEPICATFNSRWHSYKATQFKGLFGAEMRTRNR